MCTLVKAFLKSGVMTALGEREETPAGTPQGGIRSPLLTSRRGRERSGLPVR